MEKKGQLYGDWMENKIFGGEHALMFQKLKFFAPEISML